MRDAELAERVDAVPRPRHPVLWYVGSLADAKSLVVALPIDLLASTLLNRRARGGVVEAAPAFDSDYWLRHCEGFRVDTPRGSLGFVEEIIVTEPGIMPEALVVVGGLSGAERWVVPVCDVAVVQPNRERVSLESAPPVGSRG
jgi:hypothetical protein